MWTLIKQSFVQGFKQALRDGWRAFPWVLVVAALLALGMELSK